MSAAVVWHGMFDIDRRWSTVLPDTDKPYFKARVVRDDRGEYVAELEVRNGKSDNVYVPATLLMGEDQVLRFEHMLFQQALEDAHSRLDLAEARR